MAGRNANRKERFHEEMAVLSSLPARRLEMARRLKARVDSGSTIHVGGNTYSLPSRLIGEQVDIHVGAETLDVWHRARKLDTLPRLRGRGQHRVEYRHVIDWLVRKPGAFQEYRYRDSMFPTSRFRMAYDLLKDRRPGRVVQDYLAILLLATQEGESLVDEALRLLLDKGHSPDADAVTEAIRRSHSRRERPTRLNIRESPGPRRRSRSPWTGSSPIPTSLARNSKEGLSTTWPPASNRVANSSRFASGGPRRPTAG
jgi:hypothetical protein